MSVLELNGVSKFYGRVTAVNNVDLRVEAGSRTAIVGPSGSGKSTLLRIIAGFDSPDAGSVVLNGRVLADASGEIPAHQRVIGFVPQDGALFPHLTVGANISFGLTGTPSQQARRVAELMDMTALDPAMLERRPHELSGGQQQRVALARALAQRPHLMLLDEPFSALDTGLRASTRKAVAELLTQAGVTTILVTHDQAEALSFADQLAVMREGCLIQAGTPTDIYRRPVDETTAAFLGDALLLPARIEAGWADCALGRIPVDTNGRNGAARIMLRPEQVELAEVAAGAANTQGCFGVVTGIDFGGSASVLALRLVGATGDRVAGEAEEPLLVRSTGIDAPAVGATVRITVNGRAHLFNAPAR